MGELRYFLAIEFPRSKEGILMHQRKYAFELISETGLGAVKPAITPMDINVKLTTKEYGDHVFRGTNQGEPIVDQGYNQRLIGRLLYITMTIYDSSFCVQNQPGQGVLLSINKNNAITTYCHAIKMGDSLIIWKSKKQTTFSKSPAEAEYRSLVSTVAEIVWIVVLIKELGIGVLFH